MNLYKVNITRFVVAPDERTARDLALVNNNPRDVEMVAKPETMSDIPNAWRKCRPYGSASELNVEQYLISQIAATSAYSDFCIQPFKIVNGKAEVTSPLDPLAEFSVYARYGNGMAVHLANFQFQMQADLFKRRIERARLMQNMVIQAEDAHLEAQFEDQICGMLVD